MEDNQTTPGKNSESITNHLNCGQSEKKVTNRKESFLNKVKMTAVRKMTQMSAAAADKIQLTEHGSTQLLPSNGSNNKFNRFTIGL